VKQPRALSERGRLVISRNCLVSSEGIFGSLSAKAKEAIRKNIYFGATENISEITILKVNLDLLFVIKLNLSKSRLQSVKCMYIMLFACDSALTSGNLL